MKHKILLLFLACIGIANAQQPPPPPDGSMGPDPRPPGGDKIRLAFYPPELVMRNQKAINLTPDQQSTIREEMHKAMPRFTELQWKLSAEEETLESLVRTDAPDEKKMIAQFDKLMLVESELKRVRFALLVRLRAILTPEQQQKLEELKKQDRPGDPGHRPPPRGDAP
jgi:Spy/CpxP family protein refolding chaperone